MGERPLTALFTIDHPSTVQFYNDVFGAEAPPGCEQPWLTHRRDHQAQDKTTGPPGRPRGCITSDLSRLEHAAIQGIRQHLSPHGASDERVQDF